MVKLILMILLAFSLALWSLILLLEIIHQLEVIMVLYHIRKVTHEVFILAQVIVTIDLTVESRIHTTTAIHWHKLIMRRLSLKHRLVLHGHIRVPYEPIIKVSHTMYKG